MQSNLAAPLLAALVFVILSNCTFTEKGHVSELDGVEQCCLLEALA